MKDEEKTKIKKKIKETRKILENNPEVIHELDPLHKRLAQALLGDKNKRGYAAAKKGERENPSPS